MNRTRHIDLLICDCDGVLIDSEVIAERILHDALAAELPQHAHALGAVLAGTFGLQSDAILARVEAHFGIRLPEDFRERKRTLTEARIRQEVRPIAGVRDALLAIDLPLAVASNSHLDALAFALQRCDLGERVDSGVFSAQQVARPKPAPDVYLLAARTVGVAPQRCLVVEDSATGVTAALTAGMRVIGFLGASHIPAEHRETLSQLGVEHLIDDMAELPALVRRLSDAPVDDPLP